MLEKFVPSNCFPWFMFSGVVDLWQAIGVSVQFRSFGFWVYIVSFNWIKCCPCHFCFDPKVYLFLSCSIWRFIYIYMYIFIYRKTAYRGYGLVPFKKNSLPKSSSSKSRIQRLVEGDISTQSTEIHDRKVFWLLSFHLHLVWNEQVMPWPSILTWKHQKWIL